MSISEIFLLSVVVISMIMFSTAMLYFFIKIHEVYEVHHILVDIKNMLIRKIKGNKNGKPTKTA